MVKILMSACLPGRKVRYNGSDSPCDSGLVDSWKAEDRIILFCPEVAAGFPVPRPEAEIIGGGGQAVLDGSAAVVDISGKNVSTEYLDGAAQALEAARKGEASVAILKDGSPSCGTGYIYDGTFSGKRISGFGVTAALLEREGIRVFNETQLHEVANYIAEIEHPKSF